MPSRRGARHPRRLRQTHPQTQKRKNINPRGLSRGVEMQRWNQIKFEAAGCRRDSGLWGNGNDDRRCLAPKRPTRRVACLRALRRTPSARPAALEVSRHSRTVRSSSSFATIPGLGHRHRRGRGAGHGRRRASGRARQLPPRGVHGRARPHSPRPRSGRAQSTNTKSRQSAANASSNMIPIDGRLSSLARRA